MYTKVLPIVFFILAVYLSIPFSGVEGLMCYKCNSFTENSTSCKDPMAKNVSMDTCKEGEVCIKYTYLSNQKDNNVSVTARGCAPAGGNVSTCDTISKQLGDIGTFECKSCNKDHCNSAVTFGVPFIVMVITFVTTKLI